MHAENELAQSVKCQFVCKAYQIKAISQYAPPGARERESSATLVDSFDTLKEARDYLRTHAEGAERQGLNLFLSYPAVLYEHGRSAGYDANDVGVVGPYVNEHGEVVEG